MRDWHCVRRGVQASMVATVLVALLLPALPLGVWAFSQRWLYPALVPTEWGLRGWIYLLTPGVQLGKALAASLAVGIGVVGLSLLIGIPAGRALGLYRFRGRALVEFLILSPLIVPSFAPVMGIQIAFIRLGLANTLPGVILAHLIPVTPYVVLILAGAFSGYPVEVEQAARTLGADSWKAFWHVTRPMITPGIMVAGLFALTISWGQYLLTLIVGGGEIITLPLMLSSFVGSGDYTVTAALSVVFGFPVVAALLVTMRYLGGEDVAQVRVGRP